MHQESVHINYHWTWERLGSSPASFISSIPAFWRENLKKKKKSASAHEACSALLYMHITPRAPFTLWHLVESGKAQPERLPSPSWPLTVMVPECLKRRKVCRYLLHLSSLHDRCHSSRWHWREKLHRVFPANLKGFNRAEWDVRALDVHNLTGLRQDRSWTLIQPQLLQRTEKVPLHPKSYISCSAFWGYILCVHCSETFLQWDLCLSIPMEHSVR